MPKTIPDLRKHVVIFETDHDEFLSPRFFECDSHSEAVDLVNRNLAWDANKGDWMVPYREGPECLRVTRAWIAHEYIVPKVK